MEEGAPLSSTLGIPPCARPGCGSWPAGWRPRADRGLGHAVGGPFDAWGPEPLSARARFGVRPSGSPGEHLQPWFSYSFLLSSRGFWTEGATKPESAAEEGIAWKGRWKGGFFGGVAHPWGNIAICWPPSRTAQQGELQFPLARRRAASPRKPADAGMAFILCSSTGFCLFCVVVMATHKALAFKR